MSESVQVLRRRVTDLYTQSLATRLYTELKMMILPLQDVSEQLPTRGLILDMGCGYGFVSNYLSLHSADRMIIANDPEEPRIAVARETVGSRTNIEFLAVDSREITRSDFDGVCVTDVLHHVPYDQQQALIDDVYRKLKPGGVLVIRETDKRIALRYYIFNWALEWFLYMGKEKLRFRHRDEWAKMFRRAGFEIERVVFNGRWFPYTTCLFVCRKPEHE
ncbi:MAG TPA: class I SAM-dependent methyltransferase [Vicinamibacterales bacterium]|nr:class I SAM-dependent methyltransferase [Vicinamibacterales bacterium]